MARHETREQLNARKRRERLKDDLRWKEITARMKTDRETMESKRTNFGDAMDIIHNLEYLLKNHSNSLICSYDLLIEEEILTTFEHLRQIHSVFGVFVAELDEPNSRRIKTIEEITLPPKKRRNAFDKALETLNDFQFHITYCDKQLLAVYPLLTDEEKSQVQNSYKELYPYFGELIDNIEASE